MESRSVRVLFEAMVCVLFEAGGVVVVIQGSLEREATEGQRDTGTHGETGEGR